MRFDEPLSKYTSLRVGGPADALAQPDSRASLVALVSLCQKREVPLLLLGAGFNTLVRDAGVRGVVLRLHAFRELAIRPEARLRAEAGVTHASACRFCAEHGLAGLEFAVGIPGTVGGWLAMNAGVPGREMKDAVERIERLDAETGEIRELDAAELRFRYRALDRPERTILLCATFALEPAEPAAIRERMRELLAERRASQPVDRLSCGSVFMNPPGDHAGRLIEAAGLKGAREGGAEISSLHANFIVNRDRASAADVLRLIDRARGEVARRFGIELETEVKIVGGEV